MKDNKKQPEEKTITRSLHFDHDAAALLREAARMATVFKASNGKIQPEFIFASALSINTEPCLAFVDQLSMEYPDLKTEFILTLCGLNEQSLPVVSELLQNAMAPNSFSDNIFSADTAAVLLLAHKTWEEQAYEGAMPTDLILTSLFSYSKNLSVLDNALIEFDCNRDILLSNLAEVSPYFIESDELEFVPATSTELAPPPKKNTQTETQQDTRENIKELLKLVREHLSENIIGQPDAINAIMRQFKNFLVGIANPVKPIASLIFAGFTGAGKTELAKQLAIILGFPILRLDMSEFHKDHEVARLIGAPPGYIGHDEGGKLTNFVKEHPRSVIIFDEIEKADPRINDILLQIVEEGTLTDGKGNTVSLHTCFVIITTNIGAREAASNTVGFTQGDPSSKINDFLREIKKYFRPELLGRIGLDNVIVFNQLSAESLTQITKLEFKKIAERTLQFHGIKLRPTKSAVQQVQQTSNSNLYGARDLGKTIEKHVLPGLADFLLEQDLPPKHAISVSYNPKTVSYNFKIVKK